MRPDPIHHQTGGKIPAAFPEAQLCWVGWRPALLGRCFQNSSTCSRAYSTPTCRAGAQGTCKLPQRYLKLGRTHPSFLFLHTMMPFQPQAWTQCWLHHQLLLPTSITLPTPTHRKQQPSPSAPCPHTVPTVPPSSSFTSPCCTQKAQKSRSHVLSFYLFICCHVAFTDISCPSLSAFRPGLWCRHVFA